MTSQEYHAEIESLANEAAERIRGGDDRGDVVHELIDGHQWCIYTRYNFEVMEASPTDPWDEHDDQFGGPPPSPAVAAYVCMAADLNDQLSRMDLEAKEEE